MKKIYLPPKKGNTEREIFEDTKSVVITGANGSGKSRLGVWIDQNEDTPNFLLPNVRIYT